MNTEDYQALYKRAEKEKATKEAAGENPYLACLDTLLENVSIAGKPNLGLITMQMDQIVGTDTEARANAFSPSALPLLAPSSEFATKYIALYNSCEQEGLREPVTGFEYLGKYYIREGNKRVSVCKQLGLSEIEGTIIRIVPARSDDPEVVLNYEYINFYQQTLGINFLYFSKPASFKKFFSLVAGDADCFTEDQRMDVRSLFIRFKAEYYEKDKNLPLSVSDAFLTYVSLLGFEETKDRTATEIHEDVKRIWPELWNQTQEEPIAVSEKPLEKETPLLAKITKPFRSSKTLKIAFVHLGNMENSAWVYSHELGKEYVEKTFGDDITTDSFYDVSIEGADELLEALCTDGYDIIFTTSAQHDAAATKVAIAHPEVKILNCSLNASTKFVRTYYLRTYESKYLIGMIAGALTQTGKIAYVADYPVYGTIASINAFALGVSTTNPSARIYLSWSSKKEYDPDWEVKNTGCDIISNLDWSSPKYLTRKFGLYANEDDPVNFAAPLWNWGKLYEAIIKGIKSGSWKIEENSLGAQALGYWWGISSGAVDLIYSGNVPEQTIRLINYLKKCISDNDYHIFSGELKFSDGTILHPKNKLSYKELIDMDKLLWNIYGYIPSSEELKDETVSLAKVQGVLEKEE